MSDCKILRQNTFQGPGGKVSPLWQMVAGQGWEKNMFFLYYLFFFPQQKTKQNKKCFFPSTKKRCFFQTQPCCWRSQIAKKNGLQSQNPQKTAKKNFVLEGFKPPNKDLEVCTKKILRCLADGQEVPGHQETFASRRDPSPLPFPAFKEEFSTDCRGHRGVRRQCPPRNARRLLGLG